jgi:hypothetical protein
MENQKKGNRGRPEQWNRITEKGTMRQLIGLGDRERRMEIGTECGYLYIIIYTKNSYMYLSINSRR